MMTMMMTMMRANVGAEWRASESPFANRLSKSIRDALSYLCQHVQLDGRFDYVYDPIKNSVGDQYNLLRHAGTTMELYRFVGTIYDNGSVATAANKSWEYLLRFVTQVNRLGEECSCVATADVAKLGGTALMLLALYARAMVGDAPTGEIALANRLARYILSQQRTDGSFVSKALVSRNESIPFESVYYPGEAVLALCFAYRLTQESSYLAHAVQGARALMHTTSCAPNAGGRYADHWYMKSLAELYLLDPDPAWATRLRSMATPMLSTPSRLANGSAPVHWLVNSSTTNLSTRVEALLAALSVDLEMGDHPHARETLNHAQAGLMLCLERQIDCDSGEIKELKAHGGFRQSKWRSEIRIDYIHHPLGASLSFLRLEPQIDSSSFNHVRQAVAEIPTRSTTVDALLFAAAKFESRVPAHQGWITSTDAAGTGLSWWPERQIICHQAQVFVHEGPTNTEPSHNVAHLLLAASGGLCWFPAGEIDTVRVAEYNAVFLENLFHNSYMCIVSRSIEPRAILPLTIKYARWFVEHHFAPFPLTAEEAYCQFCRGLNPEMLTRLSPVFFEQKRKEQQTDYKNRQWELRLPLTGHTDLDPEVIAFQTLVSEQFKSMTIGGVYEQTSLQAQE
jgi:hypothetical protein